MGPININKVPFRLMLLLLGAIFTFVGLIPPFINAGPLRFTPPDLWARIVLIVLGVGQVIFSIYLEIRSKSAGERMVEKKSLLTTNQDLRSFYDRFTKIDERDFLEKVDLSKVSHLYILGHTGQNIYMSFRERIEKLIEKGPGHYPEEIRVLIRAPVVEGLRRNRYIHATVVAVDKLHQKDKKIDVRFYESVPAVRGIICQYRTPDQTRESYITSYYWPQSNHSKSFDVAYVTRDTVNSPKPPALVLYSWIEQYWGKDEIHTVVFDFDDTLIKTRDVQVKAWAQVIVESLENHTIEGKNLSPKFQAWFHQKSVKAATDLLLLDAVKDIFVDKQMAEAIAQEIFVDVPEETWRRINKKRFEIRERMMDKSELFAGVKDMLEKLHSHYNLAIISSTDEQLISNFLAAKGLLEYFPVILGKRDPSLEFEREKIHHKASLLIKLSEIIGMPLSRLVYIGDNNSDYLATRQLGVPFIEARQAAKLADKVTLITEFDPNRPPLGYFESFESEDLLNLLKTHSEQLTKSKYQF